MKSTLHITNGDCVADTLREAIEGEVMPWRDVLHDGPVPDVDHATLRRIRETRPRRSKPNSPNATPNSSTLRLTARVCSGSSTTSTTSFNSFKSSTLSPLSTSPAPLP